jgi:hypothetical protein
MKVKRLVIAAALLICATTAAAENVTLPGQRPAAVQDRLAMLCGDLGGTITQQTTNALTCRLGDSLWIHSLLSKLA